MTDRTISTSPSMASARPGPGSDAEHHGVRGWLLVLCLMLTVIGPVVSAWLMADQYARFAPFFAGSFGVRAAVLVSLLIAACSVAFGIYAGLRLWRVRPNAVGTAKRALLFGLAADIVTTAVDVVVGQAPTASDRLLHQVEVNLIPSLIFFTLCFAYLNKSKRVQATYESHRADA